VKTNVLYYGDNLDILRLDYIPAESIDLIYLDPPFNSNAAYNVIFHDESGNSSDAQITAFDDTWHWGPEAEKHYLYLTNNAYHQGRVPNTVSALVGAFHAGIRPSPMLAYLVEMAVRLVELHHVLKSTGSLYLHCDATASHYLKLLLDAIFEPRNYRNELIWHYKKYEMRQMRKFVKNSDRLLFYVKDETAQYVFNPQTFPLVEPKSYKRKAWSSELKRIVNVRDEAGQLIYDEHFDEKVDDVWEIPFIGATAKERLGYPTQKPQRLLERIISASSNPGDIVLDPFCGCGTATVAAQKLGRQWIGIDVTYLAIAVMRQRLSDSFPELGDIEVVNRPTELAGARAMVADGSLERRYQFQWWALDLVGATPRGDPDKKGADKGVDGVITFTGAGGKLETCVVSVKSGGVNAGMVQGLKGAMETSGAAMGLFLTLEESTAPMRQEAAEAGYYHSDLSGKDYPRLQILTVRELLEEGRKPSLPLLVLSAYQRAERVGRKAVEQSELFGG